MKFSTIAPWAAAGGLATGLVAATIFVTGATGSPATPDEPAPASAPAAAATATMPAGAMPGDRLDPRAAGLSLGWSATTPATHRGDTYQITITNGATAQRVFISTRIMDHQNDQNPDVLSEALRLAPAETKTLTAVNNYGTANHFATRLASENQDLRLQVTVTDASGAAVAQFNQGAFMVQPIAAPGQRTPGQGGHHGQHGHATPTPSN